MRTKTQLYIALFLLIIVGIVYVGALSPMLESSISYAQDSKQTNNIGQVPGEPRKIVMPKGRQLPPQYKCPVHGIIGNETLTIRIDDKLYIYCNKCAMQYIAGVFELTLPKLEVIKQKIPIESSDPNK